MRVGVGLPSTLPGVKGQLLLEWACRADDGPFSSLGVLDRLSPAWGCLIGLSTIATSR